VANSTWTHWNTYTTDTNTSYNSSDGSWISWNTTSSGTTATNNEIWYQWTIDPTTSGTVVTNDHTDTNDAVWYEWTFESHDEVGTRGIYAPVKVNRRRARLKAKRAEYRADKQTRKFKARRAMEEIEKQKAEDKAKELLLDLIGPLEMAIYERTGRVFVKGTKFDWLLQTEGNRCSVKKVTKGKVHDLCIHMEDGVIPKTDQVIGYILNAKFNEKHLDDTANLVRVRNFPVNDCDVALEAANA